MSDFDITDAALDLAEDVGIELENVVGSGVDGKITKPDVQEYIQSLLGDAPGKVEMDSDMHTIVRGISYGGQVIENTYFPSDHVDAYVSSWLQEGYELKKVIYLGEEPEGIRMLYVLVRV